VAKQPKVRVCSNSLAGTAGSKPAGGRYVYYVGFYVQDIDNRIMLPSPVTVVCCQVQIFATS
jgi:hypothetical protein